MSKEPTESKSSGAMPLGKFKSRVETYKTVSRAISESEMDNEALSKLIASGKVLNDGIGGTVVEIDLGGKRVVAKQIRLTDLERRPENFGSTKNLFNLPMYYQYGVGSAGFSAWREVATHNMTTDWVLSGECTNFPLTYGSRVLPAPKRPPMDEQQLKKLDEIVAYWGGSDAIRERLTAIHNSSASVVVFMEHIPDTMAKFVDRQIKENNATVGSTINMIERNINATTEFMINHGFVHFDFHGNNILTDGEQPYYGDFGLALSSRFDLSQTEREFLAKHRNYDRCLATSSVSWVMRDALAANSEEKSQKDHIKSPHVESFIERYRPVATEMERFFGAMRKDNTKSIAYPADKLADNCATINLQIKEQQSQTVSEIKEHKSAYKPLKINKEDPSKGSLIGIVVPSTVRVGVEKRRYDRKIIDKVTGARVPDTSTFSKAEVLAESISKLTKEGFRVDFPVDAIDQPIQGVDWANSAEERARHVINMLNNPEIEAIWAFSGGESAIEVAALLEEYDRDPDNTEAKIRQAYKARYDKEPPDNFFKPRLTSIKDSGFYNPARGLPKRGIPYLGFSDADNVGILLGQKGVVSPFYANNAEHIMDTPVPESGYAMDLCTAIQHLTSATPAIKYDGLVSLGRPLTEDLNGQMFSANGAALASSEIGPSFKLSFRKPTILALEFADQDISLVGDILFKALENGTLKNVSGIALGRVGSKNLDMAEFEKGDKGIYRKLKEFVTNSGIPVCAAQLSATELEKNGTPSSEAKAHERDNTWGHGYIPSGTIVKPFANYANAKMTTNGSLEVTGTRSLEDINISYASGIKDRVIKNSLYDDKEHKTIELNFTKIQAVQKVKAVDLSNVPFVATDITTLRLTNGTNYQINSKDKAFVLGCSQLDPGVHSTLVESQLAGVLAGAKAIIIAIPEKFTGKERDIEASIKYLQSLPQILQDFSNRYLKGETPILIANNAELANGMVKGNISINQEKAIVTSPEILEKMQKSFSELGKFTKEHKAMENKESWVQKMASRTLSGKSWDV